MEVGFLEIVGAVIGISAMNVGVIMGYIHLLHKQTEKDVKKLHSCLNSKFNAGKAEHDRLDRRIDEIAVRS